MKKTTGLLQTSLERTRLQKEVYELIRIQGMSWEAVRKKTGLGKHTISRYLRTFEADNPQLAEDMKNKKTKEDVVPEDYKKLLEENACLRGELKQAKLRADFYEKMVAFGKETYGIDLKKKLAPSSREASQQRSEGISSPISLRAAWCKHTSLL